MTMSPSLPIFDLKQTLPGGFRLPGRMTVLPLADGTLALVSPIPIDDTVAGQLAQLGEVRFLIAPNLLHHLYLEAASRRYPEASVLAPPGLSAKRPKLRIDATLDQLPTQLAASLTASVEVLRIEGAPAIDEFVFYHRAAHSLVVTDLVFNVRRPEGLLANVILFLVGCHGRFAQSRSWRLLVKDRARSAASVERLLALPLHTLIMAHGEVVHDDAHAQLARALRWLLPARPALPAGAG